MKCPVVRVKRIHPKSALPSFFGSLIEISIIVACIGVEDSAPLVQVRKADQALGPVAGAGSGGAEGCQQEKQTGQNNYNIFLCY